MNRPEILQMPNIPKPLHGLNPRVIMGEKKWGLTRQEVYKSTNYKCSACGVDKYKAKKHQWLEAHELFDIDYNKGIASFVEIVPLCHFCHSFIHSGLTRVKARNKEITATEVSEKMQHGVDVLMSRPCLSIFSGTAELCHLVGVDTCGLKVYAPPELGVSWEKWRMKWADVEYKPKFKSYNDWAQHYGSR